MKECLQSFGPIRTANFIFWLLIAFLCSKGYTQSHACLLTSPFCGPGLYFWVGQKVGLSFSVVAYNPNKHFSQLSFFSPFLQIKPWVEDQAAHSCTAKRQLSWDSHPALWSRPGSLLGNLLHRGCKRLVHLMSYLVLGPCASISSEFVKTRAGEEFSSCLFRVLRVVMAGGFGDF